MWDSIYHPEKICYIWKEKIERWPSSLSDLKMLNFITAPGSLCRPSGSSQPALEEQQLLEEQHLLEEQQLLEAGLRCRFEPPEAAFSDLNLVFASAALRGAAERLDQDGSRVKIVLEDHHLLPHAFFFQPLVSSLLIDN